MLENDFDKFWDDLNRRENSLRSYLEFEEFALGLIALVAAESDHPVYRNYAFRSYGRIEFDAYLPDGLDSENSPTCVEIKYTKDSSRRGVARLASGLDRALASAALVGAKKLLFVCNASGVDLEYLLSKRMADVDGNPELVVWGYETLAALATRFNSSHASHGGELAKRSVELRIDAGRAGKQEDLLAELREIYRTEGVSLFLGAGVSVESGIPGWDDLVSDLFGQAFGGQIADSIPPDRIPDVVTAIGSLNGGSPLQFVRYLRRALDGDPGRTFHAALSNAMYRGLKGDDCANRLLDAISTLCVPARSGSRVHAVVTYNFDDLLERHL